MTERSFIPVNEPLLNGNEKNYLNQCIDTGWISSEGSFVNQFEVGFAHRVQRKYGVAVTNGTAALDVAIEALNIGSGDEVILPTFTIISCVEQIVRSGATPVLVDSDPLTWNMDVAQVEACITQNTRAIMVVHIYGLPANMDPILSLIAKHDIALIEDAAQMIGQTYRKRPCGSFGDVSTFSFYPNKHITTGEGGMLTTNSLEMADTCRELRNLCFQPQKRFVHERLGWNLRMTNLQAAVGLAQLERLDEFVSRKRAMGRLYNELFADIECFQKPLPKTDYAENIYWVYGIVLDEDLGLDAKEIMQRLAREGVGTRPFFCPMHQQPVLRSFGLFADDSHPVAEGLYQRGLYLPSGMALTDEQIGQVAGAVKRVLV